MFAVIKTGGKQYKIQEGDILSVEKIPSDKRSASSKLQQGEQAASDKVIFEEVLLVVNGEIKVGRPFVSGARVEAKVLEDGKGEKKMVFRYKNKTRRRKKKGHRQPYTKIQITKISLN